MRWVVLCGLASLSLTLSAACSGGGGNIDGADGGAFAPEQREGTPCQQLAQAICPKLEACPESQGSTDCSYYASSEGSSHRMGISCSMCRSHFETNFCGDTTKTSDFFTTCMAAIDAAEASCKPEPNHGLPALWLPSECTDLLECKSGPCLR